MPSAGLAHLLLHPSRLSCYVIAISPTSPSFPQRPPHHRLGPISPTICSFLVPRSWSFLPLLAPGSPPSSFASTHSPPCLISHLLFLWPCPSLVCSSAPSSSLRLLRLPLICPLPVLRHFLCSVFLPVHGSSLLVLSLRHPVSPFALPLPSSCRLPLFAVLLALLSRSALSLCSLPLLRTAYFLCLLLPSSPSSRLLYLLRPPFVLSLCPLPLSSLPLPHLLSWSFPLVFPSLLPLSTLCSLCLLFLFPHPSFPSFSSLSIFGGG